LGLCDYIDAALGKVKADLVVKDARIVDVNTREIYSSDIAIKKGKIVFVGDSSELIGHDTSTINAAGLYAVPGFVDAHVHIESSMLTPTEFCKVVVKHGTTTVVWDPHEVVNVAGIEALKIAIRETSSLPLHVYFVVPSCVPSAPGRETSGACLTSALVSKSLKLPKVVGLGEIMDYPGVLSCAPELIKKIEQARRMHLVIDGHAPGLRGKELCAYVASGARSDHESVSEEEGLEKLRRGMWLMIRESSTSKDLSNLIKPLVKGTTDSRHCMFVSDDRSVNDLLLEGHMDHFLRKAISEGMDSMTAIQLATINPSNYMGIENEIGSISPGRLADVLLLSDLGKVRIERILVGGRDISQRPTSKPFRYPRRLTMTIKLKRRFVSSDFAFESRHGKEVDVVVIRMLEETLLTSKETKRLKTSQGLIEVSGDILYASVAERHRRTGNIGRGFITGLGFLDGALAQTIAHDSHNMIVVGSNPLDMLIAAREVSAMQGGIALSSRGKLVASLALGVAGLMSKESAEDVAEKKELLENQGRRLGFRVKSPVTTLSFLSLPVIPAIRLTDKGLFDVNQGMFIDPVAKWKSN
jgi:adenine deaminase